MGLFSSRPASDLVDKKSDPDFQSLFEAIFFIPNSYKAKQFFFLKLKFLGKKQQGENCRENMFFFAFNKQNVFNSRIDWDAEKHMYNHIMNVKHIHGDVNVLRMLKVV